MGFWSDFKTELGLWFGRGKSYAMTGGMSWDDIKDEAKNVKNSFKGTP